MYEELVKFVSEFGHARVPQHFLPNQPLGKWVTTQRYNYKIIEWGYVKYKRKSDSAFEQN